jgi:hypothetical protein
MRTKQPKGQEAMRTGRPTITRKLAAALLAACVLVVAACGDDGGGANSAADRERDAWEAALKYARCMREHGVDQPDPTRESGGGITQKSPVIGPNGVPEAKFREAEQACRKYLEDVEPAELSEEEQQEFREAALANARCMREHGVENFPDPTFGEDGRPELMIEKNSGIDPKSQEFREAEEACQDTLPSGESAP